MRFLGFLATAAVLLGGLHFYVWTRLFRDPAWPFGIVRVGAVALGLLCLSLPLGVLLLRRLPIPDRARSLIAAILFVWLGMVFLATVVLFAIDLGRVAVRGALALFAWWGRETPPLDPERRRALARALAGAAGATTAGMATFGILAARGEIGTREVPVRLRRLPRALEGLTLVQITDLHAGPTLRRPFVESVIERANRLGGDVVVVTGDLVDGTVRELESVVEPFARLRARYGVFFVPGNHDHYAGLAPWLEQLVRMGVRPLVNERVTLGDGAASIDLAGIDDYTGRPDLARALAGRDPERELVLLAHQPRAVVEAAAAGVGLQLSGHTHGGQIWPFGLLVMLQQPYLAGLYQHDERTQVYVSRGTGYWGPPMRIGAPAEITKIVLTG